MEQLSCVREQINSEVYHLYKRCEANSQPCPLDYSLLYNNVSVIYVETCPLVSGVHWCLVSLQVIAEGANGPTTIAAEKILMERKVLVIPVSGHMLTSVCVRACVCVSETSSPSFPRTCFAMQGV